LSPQQLFGWRRQLRGAAGGYSEAEGVQFVPAVVDAATIRRMWAAFGLQPHRSQTFKLSSDPLFVDKVRDIVGLYLSPLNRALVLSLDEKARFRHSIASNRSCR
jgi:hypothetical protein